MENVESENIEAMVVEEFKRLGFNAKQYDIVHLTDSLTAQGVEYGEVGIMAACLGYATAKGMKW